MGDAEGKSSVQGKASPSQIRLTLARRDVVVSTPTKVTYGTMCARPGLLTLQIFHRQKNNSKIKIILKLYIIVY